MMQDKNESKCLVRQFLDDENHISFSIGIIKGVDTNYENPWSYIILIKKKFRFCKSLHHCNNQLFKKKY